MIPAGGYRLLSVPSFKDANCEYIKRIHQIGISDGQHRSCSCCEHIPSDLRTLTRT
jgi:hypothetical protein